MTTEVKFPELGLADWPFGLVVDETSSKIWADRKDILSKLDRILNSMIFPTSRIHLVWGWFGAGKSHSLLHLKHLAAERGKIYSIYSSFPESCKSFLDLYKVFANSIPESDLISLYSQALSSTSKSRFASQICPNCPDFEPFLHHLQSGVSENVHLCRSWFRSDPVRIVALSKLGISKRIEFENDAIAVMESFVRLALIGGGFKRVVWMIDEFQRIDRTSLKAKLSTNNGLLTFFNRCPKNLSLILSFSYVQQDSIRNALSHELLDRIGVQEVISIPLLASQEAMEFVKELLAAYRPEGYKTANPFFPFDKSAITKVIEYIENEDGLELKPRTLRQICGLIVETYYEDIASRKISEIDAQAAQKCIEQLDKAKLQ